MNIYKDSSLIICEAGFEDSSLHGFLRSTNKSSTPAVSYVFTLQHTCAVLQSVSERVSEISEYQTLPSALNHKHTSDLGFYTGRVCSCEVSPEFVSGEDDPSLQQKRRKHSQKQPQTERRKQTLKIHVFQTGI